MVVCHKTEIVDMNTRIEEGLPVNLESARGGNLCRGVSTYERWYHKHKTFISMERMNCVSKSRNKLLEIMWNSDLHYNPLKVVFPRLSTHP